MSKWSVLLCIYAKFPWLPEIFYFLSNGSCENKSLDGSSWISYFGVVLRCTCAVHVNSGSQKQKEMQKLKCNLWYYGCLETSEWKFPLVDDCPCKGLTVQRILQLLVGTLSFAWRCFANKHVLLTVTPTTVLEIIFAFWCLLESISVWLSKFEGKLHKPVFPRIAYLLRITSAMTRKAQCSTLKLKWNILLD